MRKPSEKYPALVGQYWPSGYSSVVGSAIMFQRSADQNAEMVVSISPAIPRDVANMLGGYICGLLNRQGRIMWEKPDDAMLVALSNTPTVVDGKPVSPGEGRYANLYKLLDPMP